MIIIIQYYTMNTISRVWNLISLMLYYTLTAYLFFNVYYFLLHGPSVYFLSHRFLHLFFFFYNPVRMIIKNRTYSTTIISFIYMNINNYFLPYRSMYKPVQYLKCEEKVLLFTQFLFSLLKRIRLYNVKDGLEQYNVIKITERPVNLVNPYYYVTALSLIPVHSLKNKHSAIIQ